MQIRDHAFLVTGASSGLGAACAELLIELGGRVVLADLDEQTGQQLAERLGAAACFAPVDITDETAVQQAIDLALSRFGGLAGVVHCAGILGASRVMGREGPHDLALFRRVVEVNLVGTFNVARLAAAAMAGQPPAADGERGVIVATSSVAAFDGQVGQAAYSASKGGVASMMLPMARELGKMGIRAVAIAPGVFETPMMSAVNNELRTSLESQIPFPKRFGKPREFAGLVQQVIENSMLNGTVLRLDGALRMGPS